MTERRVPKPLTEQSTPGRSLLNLAGGDRRGLERAFQTLVGRSKPAAPARPANLAPFLEVLHKLGFSTEQQANSLLLTHSLAAGRQFSLQVEGDPDPETWTLSWVTRYVPEIEFYLPYISLRANHARRMAAPLQPGQRRPLTPEPEYDEDGFLADYS